MASLILNYDEVLKMYEEQCCFLDWFQYEIFNLPQHIAFFNFFYAHYDLAAYTANNLSAKLKPVFPAFLEFDSILFCIYLKQILLGCYLLHIVCIYILVQFIINYSIPEYKQFCTALYLKCTLIFLSCLLVYMCIYYSCQYSYISTVTYFICDWLIADTSTIIIQIVIFSIYWLYLYNQYILKTKNKLIWDFNADILLLLNIATYLNLKLITCGNLLYFIVVLEALTLLLIIVCVTMGFLKEDFKSAEEAGFKLYINNAVSTGFLLLGISLIYGITGLINLTDIAYFVNHFFNLSFSLNLFFNLKEFTLLIGFILFLVGIFTKMMQSPFHLWAKDIYEGSSFYFTAYLATISKVGILFFFVNNILLFNNCNILLTFCMLIGLISTLIGGLGAIQQKKFKSFIAYTSIAAIGPLLIICGVSISIENNTIITLIVLPYILSYLFIVLLLFMSIGRIGKLHLYTNIISTRTLKKKIVFLNIKDLSELAGLWYRHKYSAFLILILLLTLIAIPPFFNFLLKTYILLIFVKTNNIFIAFIFLLYGVLSCVYYLRLIKLIIFDNINNHIYILKSTFFLTFIISVCAIFLTIGFIYPKLIITLFFSLI